MAEIAPARRPWTGRAYVYTPPTRRPAKDAKELPPQRAKVLAFIEAERAAGRPFPSRQAIAARMGWKTIHGVYEVLGALVGCGRLRRVRGKRDGRFDCHELVEAGER